MEPRTKGRNVEQTINHSAMAKAAKKRAQVLLNSGKVVTLVYWPIPVSEYRGNNRRQGRHGSKPVVTLNDTETPYSVYVSIEIDEIVSVWTVNSDGIKEEVKWN